MLPEYLLELLTPFDHIFIGCQHSADAVARMTGRPCTFLPMAVDVPSFAPVAADLPRSIDVASIGRRSQVTHAGLLREAERPEFFYYYDTVAASGVDRKSRTFFVEDAAEHRRMLSTLLKNSRYFIANRAYVDRPEFIAGREEISPRFYEGAASGTVMLGEAPRVDEFRKEFDWPDAVIHLPFDSPNIGRIIAELDEDEGRLLAARRNGIREAALRHDWLHRIQVVFDVFGLSHTEQMHARAAALARIADGVGAYDPTFAKPRQAWPRPRA
jgi:hypothetical protein